MLVFLKTKSKRNFFYILFFFFSNSVLSSMSDKIPGDMIKKTNLSQAMHVLSASSISLHTPTATHANDKKTKKSTNTTTSVFYFLALFYSFFSMGLGTGIIGPTLLKFREQLNIPLDRVVYIVFTRSGGFLIGTLLGGTLIDRYSSFGRTFLSCSVGLMCLATLVIPFIYNLIPMILVHLIWSFSAGVVDNLAQILTIRHYENKNFSPYLQAVHGAFGIGALLSPLIIAPFLQKTSAIDQWHCAYWFIGLLHVPNLVWILVYAIRDEFLAKKTRQLDLENKEFVSEGIIPSNDNEQKLLAKEFPRRMMFVLILITVFLLLYVGAESAFGAYLHTYASLHLHFEKDVAAYLNSLFWTSFAFGRLCGIPLSIKFSPLQMISVDLIGCVLSLTLLFIFNHQSTILWIGSILYGLSVASIYPSAIAYTETHMTITGKRMSILAVGGSAGDALIPLLIGYSMNLKSMGPIGFTLISLIVAILASLLFAFIVLFIRFQPPNEENENESEK